MWILELIGWAFIAGCVVCAFITPIAILIRIFDGPKEATHQNEPSAAAPTAPPPPKPKR